MSAIFNARPVRATAFAFAIVLGLAGPAFADFTTDFPVGLACPGFTLRVQGIGADPQPKHSKDNKDGSVTFITAGRGFQLTFTNLSNSQTLSLRSNGSVNKTTVNADGTATVQVTGNSVLIMYPSDLPPGPTSTLYAGRVVFTVDASGNFALLGTYGKSTDICAALA